MSTADRLRHVIESIDSRINDWRSDEDEDPADVIGDIAVDVDRLRAILRELES